MSEPTALPFPWSADLTVTGPLGATSFESVAESPAALLAGMAAAFGLRVTIHEGVAPGPLRSLDALTASLAGDAPATSVAAYQRAFPRSGTRRRDIVVLLMRRGGYGATDDEIEAALSLRHQTASAARRMLVIDGWIRAQLGSAGHPVTRTIRTGNDAQVWVLTTAGRAGLLDRGEAHA